MDNDKTKPIAVVGLSFRFPGDANTTEGFWEILKNARTTRTKVPNDRFNIDGFYHPNPDRPGAIITKEGCFLKEDVGLFDAPFFGITASEAEGMDPQHRLLLEITYEAFENAGIPINKVAGTETGCYVGGFSSEYVMVSGNDINNQSMYQSTGCGDSMLSNRLSWFYDLRGPSFSIDTACSSSMVALHEACRDIQDGTITMGIVAGSSLMLVADLWRALSSQRFLSPDGTCHSFDSQANGYGRGEGMGVLIVKPLADALQDNDVIRAVIRGSGINQDGKTPAITVPNPHAQMSLIRSTYAKAGLDMNRTTYFEAHGTGTPVGDPLELLAIGQTIGASRGENGEPILVGSVKSNIGHLEGSSGIAGVIKTILALEHGEIPAVAEFKSLNPRINQQAWNIKIPMELTPWPAEGLRRASINSFGYGGSNGHVIIDDALHYLEERGLTGNHNTMSVPTQLSTPSSQSTDSAISLAQTTPGEQQCALEPKLFVFTSPEQDGLARLAVTYATHLAKDALSRDIKGATLREVDEMNNLSYTLAARRTFFDWRSFAVADSLTGLQVSLEAGLPKHGRMSKNPSCAFVFTGQGAQWYAMGRELLAQAVFRTSIADANDYVSSLGSGWSLTEELSRDKATSRINDPEISQPLCTALQVALVDLLRHWGLEPKAVVGHSSGEIGAAYAAGVLTREDAWKVAYCRGARSAQITSLLKGRKGSMLAVALSEEAALSYLTKVEAGDVVVACINSPNSITISGDDFAVAEVEKLLMADKIWCRRLLVKTAYHSPHMEVIADMYREDIQDIKPLMKGVGVTIFSSVTGSEIDGAEMGIPEYWVKNLVGPVHFSAAVSALLKPRDTRSRRKGMANVGALVELGPHAALQGPLRDILMAANETYVASVPYTAVLQRGQSAVQTAVTAAGRLWCSGFSLNLELINSMNAEPVRGRPLANLPRYPFNHKRRYWHEARGIRCANSHPSPRTDLLGQRTFEYNTVTPTWKNYLSPSEIPWLMDHKVHGLLVMPGAVFIAMVMEALRNTADAAKTLEGYEFRDIVWHKPIIFESPDAHIEVVTQLAPHRIGTKSTTATWTRFSITTVDASTNEASEHCSGLVERRYVTRPGEIENGTEAVAEWDQHRAVYAEIQAKPTITLDPRSVYGKMNARGLQFGPTFRNMTSIHSGWGYMHGHVVTPDTAATMPEGIEYPLPLHPAVLDACFQMLDGTGQGEATDVPLLPNSIEGLYVSADIPTTAGTVLKGYCTCIPESRHKISGSTVMSNETWEKPLIVLRNLVVTAATGPQTGPPKTSYMFLDWVVDVNHSKMPLRIEAACDAGAAVAEIDDSLAISYVDSIIRAAELNGGEMSTELQNYLNWLRSLDISSGTTIVPRSNEDAEPTSTRAIEKIAAELAEVFDPNHETTAVSRELISQFVDESLGRSFADSVVVNIIDHVGSVNPNVEVLEIASSNSTNTASQVLSLLAGKTSRINKYIWTSRDKDAVETATQALEKSHECLEIKKLDVESGLEEQGFVLGKLDFVVLSDLSLATADRGAALRNIVKLLKPNGKIIVQAITKMQFRTAFALGSSPSWWRDGPPGERLDEARWNELLKNNGFTGIEQAYHDSEDSNVHHLSVMTSSVHRESLYEHPDVLLLMPLGPSDNVVKMAENCATKVAKLGLNAIQIPWNEVGEFSGKMVISLVELDGAVYFDLSEDLFNTTKAMALRAGAVLWLTHSGKFSGSSAPGYSICSGLFRSVRSEDDTRPIATLDLSTEIDLASPQAVDIAISLFESLFGKGGIRGNDKEFAEDNGFIYVQRLVEDIDHNAAQATAGATPQPINEKLFQGDRKLMMTIGQIGALDSLQFEDSTKCAAPLPAHQVEVKVMFAGLNFLDIMGSLGEVPQPKLGSEITGIVTEVGSLVTHLKPGDKVVASCSGGFASHVRMKSTACHHIPKNLTMEEAATIPIAFTTAWIGLVDLGRMRKGETILIHSAAGGVGQAAIQLCQHFGVEVFATVGSNPKKRLLMEQYGIPQDHIFSSRDTTFAQGIRRITNGRGVDLVLNSVAGEFLRQSWHLIAQFGRFIEIGKRDILGNTGLDMEPFIRSVSFIGLNLERYKEDMPEFDAVENAHKHIFELISAGMLRPLRPINVYDFREAPKAFRALQSGNIIGKVVMRATTDAVVPVVPRLDHPLVLDPKATYLLAGGLGGIGRSIALMMHAHGARNLAFVSRSGDSREIAKTFLKHLRGIGCVANAYACDIANVEQLTQTIKHIESQMAPIKGSIQCAMTLRDAIFDNMNYDDWVICTRPKIQGSWNLHALLPQELDFFIMLASTSGVLGNPGQANYAAGNTFEDALAHFRRRQGQKAVALDIGAVRDVGYLAEADDKTYWNMSHIQSLTVCEADIHFLVKNAITGYTIGSRETGPQIVAGLAGTSIDEKFIERSPWVRDGKLCIVLKASLDKKTAGIQAGIDALAKASNPAVAAAIIEEIILKRVAAAIMIPEEDISVGEPLQNYGVNSLVAVEIKTWLAKEFQTDISVTEISPSTISILVNKIVATSKLLRSLFKENNSDKGREPKPAAAT